MTYRTYAGPDGPDWLEDEEEDEATYTANDLAEDIVRIIDNYEPDASYSDYREMRRAILEHLRQCEFIK